MLLIAATIMTIAGSFFGAMFASHLSNGEDNKTANELSHLFLALWLGGTLAGTALFVMLAW
jgi:hypothetical protein